MPDVKEEVQRVDVRGVDLSRATEDTPEVREKIADMFDYHPWNSAQVENGARVREALAEAYAVIIANVPPGPDRSVAIRKLREARMDANSAITHLGRY